ncbi:hypothetical protein F5Y19DRAFT_476272 [Xylariaceae sp. FL1651]|nr:hypothetical protein F5Y19DRAFT_476272 [Xylariaceae sp. FL1651]
MGFKELKLKGYPWEGHIPSPQRNNLAAPAILVSKLLEALFNTGWLLVQRTSLLKRRDDEEVLIFRQGFVPKACDWVTIHTYHDDWLFLIQAPNDVIRAVRRIFPVQKDNPAPWYYAIKIKGTPWASYSRTSEVGMRYGMGILSTLEQRGWALYATVNFRKTDTWHFRRDKNTAEAASPAENTLINSVEESAVDPKDCSENPFETTAENIIDDDYTASDAGTESASLIRQPMDCHKPGDANEISSFSPGAREVAFALVSYPTHVKIGLPLSSGHWFSQGWTAIVACMLQSAERFNEPRDPDGLGPEPADKSEAVRFRVAVDVFPTGPWISQLWAPRLGFFVQAVPVL